MLLKKWIGTSRWTYNQCVAFERFHNSSGRVDTWKSLMRWFVIQDQDSWVHETPQCIRDNSLLIYLEARKSAFANKRNGNISKFMMRFKSKKNLRSDSIRIPHREYTRVIKSKSSRVKQFDVLKRLNPVKGKELGIIDQDFTIQYNFKLNHWYINIPERRPVCKDENQVCNKHKIVSIDPGVRTFATCYTPDGYAVEIGPEDRRKLCYLGYRADKLQSKISHSTGKSKHRCRVAFRRMHERIRNLTNDLHCKVVNWLCKSFSIILIPPYKTSCMSKRCNRRLNSKTVRQMLTWSYYKFKQRLLFAAKQCGVAVLSVDESYTSQTCGLCGTLRKTSEKWYKCKDRGCNFEADRDVNGARNILIRTLGQL